MNHFSSACIKSNGTLWVRFILKEDVQSLLKTFQLSTRQLHHMCGHSKVFLLYYFSCVLIWKGEALVDVWKQLIIFKRICAVVCFLPDSSGYQLDKPCPSLEEESGAVPLQSEGHAGAQQLPGSLLDGESEEPQSEGQRSSENGLLNADEKLCF